LQTYVIKTRDNHVEIPVLKLKVVYCLYKIQELKQIISQDYPAQSAGYKAATIDILKKLK
jgi:hypothetical protein